MGLAQTHSPSGATRILEDEKNWHTESEQSSSSRHDSTLNATGDDEEKSWEGSTHGQNHSTYASAEDKTSYRYLTFDTTLPTPSIASLSDEQRRKLPAQPDLSKTQCPLEWSSGRKTFTLAISCTATALTACCAGGYSPGSAQMQREWHVGAIPILCGITTFTTGFAVAPMVLAPFSEINGRKPVFLATGALWVVCMLCCALTRSYGGLLAARFFVGVGGSTFSTMVGGVVSDIFAARERNAAMALFSCAAMFGTGLGPLACAFIAQNLSWRWMFWVQLIVDGALVLALALFFNETRASVLLSRRAKVLNKWYDELELAGCPGFVFDVAKVDSSSNKDTSIPSRFRWKVASDEERASIATMIRISVSRPFHLLFTEPILFSFSLWVSFSWMVLYLTLAAIPYVYSTVYGFDVQSSGAVFAALMIAALTYTPITIFQERWAYARNWLGFRDRTAQPEHRLFFVCVQALFLPAGLFIFGWAARPTLSPAASALGLVLATWGIFAIYLATFNYLADVYGPFASSALAAQSFCRNMAGGAIPLFTTAMYRGLGIGPASSLLGAVGLVLGVVPWILLVWGARIRARSPFAVGEKR